MRLITIVFKETQSVCAKCPKALEHYEVLVYKTGGKRIPLHVS
jgi:hypothetical protein